MNILITGASGFLGTLLAREILKRGQLRGRAVSRLVLTDLMAPSHPEVKNHPKVSTCVGDLLEKMDETLAMAQYDAVFHLASAVSGECEADFGLGLRSNLDATRRLLDGLRAQQEKTGQAPMFFFSSSVAVFGSDPALPMDAVITDKTLPTPQSSYGIHKFVCEQLVADYTRKGFIDGRAARLMTVSVRPGRPNGAASGFLSGLFREPLAGQASNNPVALDSQVALSSPANTVAGIVAVMEASREAFGGRTAINLPALTVSVREMLLALEELAGPAAMALITHRPDEAVARIVSAWPARFESQRTDRLGLKADADFANVLRQYVADNADAVTLPAARARLGLR